MYKVYKVQLMFFIWQDGNGPYNFTEFYSRIRFTGTVYTSRQNNYCWFSTEKNTHLTMFSETTSQILVSTRVGRKRQQT